MAKLCATCGAENRVEAKFCKGRIVVMGHLATATTDVSARIRVLLSCVMLLLACGCIEVEQRVKVHQDGTAAYRATIKIDPQFEALVLPQMKDDLPKKAPPGVRLDFSQRIDGKAAVVIEADGAAADAMLKEDGSTTITVSDSGFMKRRYEYRGVVTRAIDVLVPMRSVVSLPGSIESVSGGTKTASDTVEFDLTDVKRGDVFSATSTAFVFSLGRGGVGPSNDSVPGTASWLMPASVVLIVFGVAVLLMGWLKARTTVEASGPPGNVAAPAPTVDHSAVNDTSRVFCSECGAANAAGCKFCGQCGRAME